MEPFVVLGISLGLGLLIGMQRERTEQRLGGIRTFPLISLLGTLCGMMGEVHGGWVIAAGFLVTLGVLILSNLLEVRGNPGQTGQTTEVAALVTYAIGAYLVEGSRAVAVAVGGATVLLLHGKQPLHSFVGKMGRQDVRAIMQFVIISLIILPLLPDEDYGPFKVFNPYDIWRMVVLIVGISLAGYIAYKLLGSRAGTWVGGMLGGLISSTATTVSYARRAKGEEQAHRLAVVAILIASTIAYLRVIIELAVVARESFPAMVLPIAAMLAWMAAVAVTSFLLFREKSEDIPPPDNPAELKSALFFGGVYALVLLAAAASKHFFGSGGLYVVALISGLTDMDAITLSIAGMVESGGVDVTNGWRLILVASLSNLAFKGAAGLVLGGLKFGMRLWLFFGICIVGGSSIILFWPEAWTVGALPEFKPKDG